MKEGYSGKRFNGVKRTSSSGREARGFGFIDRGEGTTDGSGWDAADSSKGISRGKVVRITKEGRMKALGGYYKEFLWFSVYRCPWSGARTLKMDFGLFDVKVDW